MFQANELEKISDNDEVPSDMSNSNVEGDESDTSKNVNSSIQNEETLSHKNLNQKVVSIQYFVIFNHKVDNNFEVIIFQVGDSENFEANTSANAAVVNAYILYISVMKPKQLTITQSHEQLVLAILQPKLVDTAPETSLPNTRHKLVKTERKGRCNSCYLKIAGRQGRKEAMKLTLIYYTCSAKKKFQFFLHFFYAGLGVKKKSMLGDSWDYQGLYYILQTPWPGGK